MKKVASLIILFLLSYPVLSQNRNILQQLSENLSLISIYGVNTLALSGEDRILIVDTGYEEAVEILKKELKNLGDSVISVIISTHWHYDHVGNNKIFGKGATIIAHKSVRELLSNDDEVLGEQQKAHPAEVLPDITIENEIQLYYNDEEISLLPLTGGHTGGDILVYFKNSNIVHIGDIVFADIFPFVDVDHGGSVIQLAKNLEILIKKFDKETKFIPGHGRILTKSDISAYQKMVAQTTEIVRKEMNNGRSIEDIQKANVLEEWKDWGVAFSCNDWIEMIYNSIRKENR